MNLLPEMRTKGKSSASAGSAIGLCGISRYTGRGSQPRASKVLERNSTLPDGVGSGRAMPPQDHAPGVHHVAPAEAAIRGEFHGLGRAHADVVGPAHVGRPEQVEEPALVPVIGALGAVGKGRVSAP
jgi:hypothetical protein